MSTVAIIVTVSLLDDVPLDVEKREAGVAD
jgi:hypothetical protein